MSPQARGDRCECVDLDATKARHRGGPSSRHAPATAARRVMSRRSVRLTLRSVAHVGRAANSEAAARTLAALATLGDGHFEQLGEQTLHRVAYLGASVHRRGEQAAVPAKDEPRV